MQTRPRPTPALSIGDLIWQAFFSPAEGLSNAARQQPIGWAIAFIVVIPFIYALVAWTPHKSFFDAPWKDALLVAVIASLSFLIYSAAIHWISRLLGGQGSYLGLFSALAFAFMPPALFHFLIVNLTKPMGDFGGVLKGLGDIGSFVWGLVLEVIAVREAHGLSTLRAIGVLVIFWGVIFGLLILLSDLLGRLLALFILLDRIPILAMFCILLAILALTLWLPWLPGRR